MTLTIQKVADKGDIEKERLVLKALEDLDIGDYLLLRTSVSDNMPTTAVHNTLWLPNKDVKSGDLIIIYSKSGTKRSKDMENGRTAHFYYWGSQAPLWSEAGRGAVLLNAPEWEFKSSESL
jgi:hypothetical protein